MITFKNIAGNKFLAVGTIQRKSALNGEKSLTGTLYDGKDVLNKIDKGWSLEFDGEPYVVTYFERNDNDNSVSFDAIHKFFWDMAKKVLYSSTEISGSHTIKWYLDQIFANTGYTYALNFSPAAIEKDNWGNKTRLSLFNDLITSIAGEFEINGTLISIFQNIGTDLSTIVRYGFNLSDMTLENDATSFVTYGEGFGAYADQENQTGDRVHVTYTSPLAGVYGILQAEPIDDQRYTSQANLQAAVKSQVDASFSVSVQLSLYDLTAAGYPYKMANVGDWLTAVDENLDFKQRIRIISIDDEFSADGTRISYTVTAGDVGLTKKYQDANASISSQIANAVASASQASTDANNALISANGKNISYYLNSVDDLPVKANEGDLAWVKSGDGTVMYIYTKKADGSYYWEKRIDPEMGDQIAAGVTEAVTQANAHTDEVKQGLSTDIDTAKSQAASQASTAEANAKSAATSQFNQAQSALSAAKSDLTNSIASEASARNTAVAAANSQAQTYVNQAKSDINDTIKALSVGGRNLLLNSKNLSFGVGTTAATSTKVSYDSTTNMWHITSPKGSGGACGIYFWPTNNVSNIITKGQQWAFSFDIKGTGVYSNYGIGIDSSSPFNKLSGNVPTDWTRASSTGTATEIKPIIIYFDARNVALDVYVKLPKLETGNLPTDYTQAPEDIVLDYTTKDNQIKETITQYKDTNDGKVSQAQTDATTALGLVASKVSQTDYNTKTGDLDSKYTVVKQTVDQASTDIASIKQKYSDQDAKMNSIVSDANGTKQTVSDLQTAQGKQSGDISTLQQRADGFDATVTKVNNMSVGGRNYLIGTTTSNSTVGSNANNQSKALYKITLSSLDALYKEFKKTSDYFTLIFDWTYTGTNPSGQFIPQWNMSPYGFTGKYVTISSSNTSGTAIYTEKVLDIWSGVTGLPYIQMRFDNVPTTGTVTISNMRLMSGNMSYPWTPAPEDLSGATAKAQLTADNAALNLSKYQTDADGRISKAQADIVTNANAITQKVSQTDYDKKTGDLTTAVSKAQSTADGVVTTVGNYKTSNDARVKSAETSIAQNSKDITLRATTDDLNSAKSDLNSSISQVKITADSISNFVRDSSGNISSDFQTALSKTSIVTGSTLATSIQTQTSSQITSALTDNNGKIISLINQDSSGVQIAGKNLAITADTTVDGNFWAKQVNAIQVNASNITTGTLNASNVNIINLNVNSLTGNVSNFIQSNWNGEYSSTKISSTGMQIGGFTANGFDTIFDKTGITFETTDARYGYAIAHYGTDAIKNSSGTVMARGMEIRTGNENGIGFDYFAIKSPGANNLELGKTTNAGHVSIAVVPDTNLMPIFNKGVTILDDLYVGKVNGAKAGGLFSVLAGRTIHIPTSMNNNGTVGGWLDITL